MYSHRSCNCMLEIAAASCPSRVEVRPASIVLLVVEENAFFLACVRVATRMARKGQGNSPANRLTFPWGPSSKNRNSLSLRKVDAKKRGGSLIAFYNCC